MADASTTGPPTTGLPPTVVPRPPSAHREPAWHRRLGAAGIALLIVGLLCCLGYRVESGHEHHAYADAAPGSVRLTAGKTYELSYPGGLDALGDKGLSVTQLRCSWGSAAQPGESLPVTATWYGNKATNVIATFTAPATGEITISCGVLGTMYVDNADNTQPDRAGLFLLLAVITLTLGAGLALSGLRTLLAGTPRRAGGAGAAAGAGRPVGSEEAFGPAGEVGPVTGPPAPRHASSSRRTDPPEGDQ